MTSHDHPRCDDFLGAAARHTHELWHPVKSRGCWASYLDACNATGCHEPPPPLQVHCRDAEGFMRRCAPAGSGEGGRGTILPYRNMAGKEVPAHTCQDPCQ